MADKKKTEKSSSAKVTEDKKSVEQPKLTKEAKQYPDIKPGYIVRVHEKITEVNPKGEEKQRIQVFEGMVLQRKHGKGINATITVRKVSNGIGVEKIFPLSLPVIDKIEVVKRYKVRRASLGYLRNYYKKLKEIKS